MIGVAALMIGASILLSAVVGVSFFLWFFLICMAQEQLVSHSLEPFF